MSGWAADGRTNPRWRSCAHEPKDGRCVICNARHILQFQQSVSRPSMGATPLGGNLVLPNLGGTSGRALADHPGSFMPHASPEATARGQQLGNEASRKE